MVVLLSFISTSIASTTVSDCASGDAPSPYYAYDCHDVCEASMYAAGWFQVVCDISGASGDGDIYFVYDYAGESFANFSSWGVTSTGTDFCCFIEDSSGAVNKTFLYGGGGADIVSYQGGGISMQNPTSGTFLAYAYGGAGNDAMTGSDETDSYFADLLYGQLGLDGMFGGQGADRMDGGGDNDDMYGEGGNDLMKGGTGADDLFGAAGDNTLCGDGSGGSKYGDSFKALAGANVFWQAYSAFGASPEGEVEGSSTTCGHTSWGSAWVAGTCSYSLTTAPSGCSGF